MRSLEEVLQSTSATLFPSGMGKARVTLQSRDSDGDTALHVLLRRGDSVAAQLLIDAGADVTALGDMGESPLHIAVDQKLVGVVEQLLSAGANPDLLSEFGVSPRQRAIAVGGATGRLLKQAAPNNSFKPNPLRGSA